MEKQLLRNQVIIIKMLLSVNADKMSVIEIKEAKDALMFTETLLRNLV